MELVHTFTKKLETDVDRLNKILKMYSVSFQKNSKYHNVKLYTDTSSFYLLKDVYENIEIVDTSDLHFTDDLKFKTISLLNDNQLLIDSDIFLTKALDLKNNFDIICEVNILFINNSFYNYYVDIPNVFIENGVIDAIPFFSNKLLSVPNIGILKFKKESVKEEYINYYYKIKDWYIKNNISNKIENYSNLEISAVLAQYLLGLFAKEYGYSISYANEYNEYTHYSGNYKYTDKFYNEILRDKKEVNTII